MTRLLAVKLILVIGLLLALVGCGGNSSSNTPTNDEPAATTEVNVSLATTPDPPEGGEVELVATVTDAQGQPIEDAEVFFMANHTEMGGMDMEGQATAQGEGHYAITTNFSMGGTWKVTVQVNQGVSSTGDQRTVKEFDLGVE